MSNLKLFGLSILCSMFGVLGYFCVQRQIESKHETKLTRLHNSVWLTSQLRPDNMQYIRSKRIRMVIDMRPDGEAADQPSSGEMKQAADLAGIKFRYIPVPHESLPDEAVASLQSALQESSVQTVLYCRTGRRATRLFALAIASQAEGPEMDDILNIVSSAGFTADDLREEIAHRIAKRPQVLQEAKL